MGTNNFHYRNTSHCFAFAPKPYIDEDTGEEVQPEYEFEYDCFIESLYEQFKEEFKPEPYVKFQKGMGSDWHGLRSFPSRVIGRVNSFKKYGDIIVCVTVVAVVRSGYYEGCCCDWLVEYETGGSEAIRDDTPDEDDIYTDLEYYSERMNHGLCRIMAGKAVTWMESEKDRLVERVEKVFRTCTNYELVCLGHASNGETFYRQVQ